MMERKKLIKRKCQYFADTDRPDTFQEAKVASKCAEGGSFPHTTELCFPFKQDRDRFCHRKEIGSSKGAKYFPLLEGNICFPHSRNILFKNISPHLTKIFSYTGQKYFLPLDKNIFLYWTDMFSYTVQKYFLLLNRKYFLLLDKNIFVYQTEIIFYTEQKTFFATKQSNRVKSSILLLMNI